MKRLLAVLIVAIAMGFAWTFVIRAGASNVVLCIAGAASAVLFIAVGKLVPIGAEK